MLDPHEYRTWDKCQRFLQTARASFDGGDAESGASRAYYALYHMTVLLLSRVKGRTRDRWDHNQLHQAFLDEFCKLGFGFSDTDGNDWANVKETRLLADYGRNPLSRNRAQRSIARAERLIAKMRAEIESHAH